MKRVLTLREAAEVLGISVGTAYTLAREGRFPVPVIKVGVQYKVSRAELAKLLGEAKG